MFIALSTAVGLSMAYSALADQAGTNGDTPETAQIGTGDTAVDTGGDPSVGHRPAPHVRKDSGVEFRRNDHPAGARSTGASAGSSDSSSDSSGGGGGSSGG
jgi:hypothetical protein